MGRGCSCQGYGLAVKGDNVLYIAMNALGGFSEELIKLAGR